MKRTRRRVSRKRNTSRKYSKKRYSKKYSKKRYSKKRYSKKRISRKRVHRGGSGDAADPVELGIFLKKSGDFTGLKGLFGSLDESRYLRIETPEGKDQSDRVLAYYKYTGKPGKKDFSITKTGEGIRLEDYHMAAIFSGTDRYGHEAEDDTVTAKRNCIGFVLYPNDFSGRIYEFLWADGFLTGDYKEIYKKMYPSVGEGRKQVDFDKFDAITRRYNAEYGAVLEKVSRGLISPDELETALRSSEPKLALNQLIQRVEESEAEA
jgi:hypothetical protein